MAALRCASVVYHEHEHEPIRRSLPVRYKTTVSYGTHFCGYGFSSCGLMGWDGMGCTGSLLNCSTSTSTSTSTVVLHCILVGCQIKYRSTSTENTKYRTSTSTYRVQDEYEYVIVLVHSCQISNVNPNTVKYCQKCQNAKQINKYCK